MLAEYGTLTLADVLAPAIQMADGYPIEAQTADAIEAEKARIKQWKYSTAVFLPHLGAEREAPEPGEVFVQRDLAATLRKLVEAERKALEAGKSRKQAIYAAYDRFYKGDIARELVRGVREEGGLITLEDLARWKVKIEEPLSTDYKGIERLQAPGVAAGAGDASGPQHPGERGPQGAWATTRPAYIHTLYQAMNLAFADRDFYYGDPAFPPDEPVRGLLSKDYAKARLAQIEPGAQRHHREAGRSLPLPGRHQPVRRPPGALDGAAGARHAEAERRPEHRSSQSSMRTDSALSAQFSAGTTSIEAADEDGWVVSVTPSGGWVPAVIAGHTGVGLSQRAQSFVTRPGGRTLQRDRAGQAAAGHADADAGAKDGAPYLAFAVQGGDSQDQILLQFFLDVVEFGMTRAAGRRGARTSSASRCAPRSGCTSRGPGPCSRTPPCPTACAPGWRRWATP